MRAVYFAWVRERVGKAEEELDPPSTVTTVGDLIAWLSRQGENYAIAFDKPATVRAALDGALDNWTATPKGTLALVIVLDQFPRNMFRGNPMTYASDAAAPMRASRRTCASFSTFPSCTRSICRISTAASTCSARPAVRTTSNTPKTMPRSSVGSAVSPTATAFWGARHRPRSRPSWTRADSPADDATMKGHWRRRFGRFRILCRRVTRSKNDRSFREDNR